MDALVEDARTVPFQALDEPAMMPTPPEPPRCSRRRRCSPRRRPSRIRRRRRHAALVVTRRHVSTTRMLLSSPFPSDAVPVPSNRRAQDVRHALRCHRHRRPRRNDLVDASADGPAARKPRDRHDTAGVTASAQRPLRRSAGSVVHSACRCAGAEGYCRASVELSRCSSKPADRHGFERRSTESLTRAARWRRVRHSGSTRSGVCRCGLAMRARSLSR